MNVFVSSLADNPVSSRVLNTLNAEITSRGLQVRVRRCGSFGYYDVEPLVLIEKPGYPTIIYNNVTPDTAAALVRDFLTGDNLRADLAFCCTGKEKIGGIKNCSDLPLFHLQNRISLRNCGFIDPEDINDYISRAGGYRGFARVLKMQPDEMIEETEKAGLRERGGNGNLIAEKWQAGRETRGDEKYVICSAVDYNPQANTARLLLESDPHSVLEGLLITACGVGASRCVIAVDNRYQPALERLRKALDQMRECGLVGTNILDSGRSIEIRIKEIDAALVLREETALIRMLEDKPGMPYIISQCRGVYEFQGYPAVVDNIETAATLSAVFLNGPERSSSDDRSEWETRIITLTGSAAHKYTVEVPTGIILRSLLDGIGGGAKEGKKFKAVQFSGPTGKLFSDDSLDNSINRIIPDWTGTTVGSETVEVFAGDTCAVEISRNILSYIQGESCGKCVFCREGTYQMADILEDISGSRGKHQDIDLLEELGEQMKLHCICKLGRTAPDPVLSSLRLFRRDFETHITEKRCPLGNY